MTILLFDTSTAVLCGNPILYSHQRITKGGVFDTIKQLANRLRSAFPLRSCFPA